jgi:hypothetical protein
MERAALQFQTKGTPVECEPYGCGHINTTYLVTADTGSRYIMQKINLTVFPDVDGLMENVAAVTSFLAAHTEDPRGAMHLVPTREGKSYWRDENGGCWRMYDFVEDSLCLQAPESDQDFYESAIAFGRFQQQMASFDAATLHETIPNFHNTPDRYRQFKETVAADPMGRRKDVENEIKFALAREAEAGSLRSMQERGELPLRVTHNDTKLNNVMLDAVTRRALCVIDLDTVMPGLSLYDFGDSIRFGAATALEDERDLSKMEMSLHLFRIYTRGFLTACPGLTAAEKAMLPMGAKLMTLECGIRFLKDHLDGDRYFTIHRPGQNLDRARTQFRLVADMEKKWDEMASIVAEEAKR